MVKLITISETIVNPTYIRRVGFGSYEYVDFVQGVTRGAATIDATPLTPSS
jgi:hypothetical protein